MPEISSEEAAVLANQFVTKNVPEGVIIGEPEAADYLLLFTPGTGTSEPYDILLERPAVYVDTNTGATGWFSAADWPDINFEDE